MQRASLVMILALIPFLTEAASRTQEPLTPTDEAAALAAAQRLFGNRTPKLELIESGKVFKGGLYATFASPSARISERLSTYTSILCFKDEIWNCVLGYPEAQFVSNGMQHRNFLQPDTDADALVEVADFIYSECFRRQLQGHPNAEKLAAPQRITSISQRGPRFSVQGFVNRTYEIARVQEPTAACKFTLIGVGVVVE